MGSNHLSRAGIEETLGRLYINMPHMKSAGGAGFYGSEHGTVRDRIQSGRRRLRGPGPASAGRLQPSRQARRGRCWPTSRTWERQGPSGPGPVDVHTHQRARGLFHPPRRAARLNLRSEPRSRPPAIGIHGPGPNVLFCRRLVEGGSRFSVSITAAGTYPLSRFFPSLEKTSCRSDRASRPDQRLDQAALLSDRRWWS